jgi:hypothetical protein
MADLELLKFARARDDQHFVLRVAAATTHEAGTRLMSGTTQTASTKALMDWALANPINTTPLFLAFAANSAAVAAKVTLIDGTVDTTEVLDADIRAIVAQVFDVVALQMFPQG